MSSVSPSLEAPPAPHVGKIVVAAIVMGVAIAAIGVIPWIQAARLNARAYPEWPWAAAVTCTWLLVMITWLGGMGWPRSTSAFRRFHLRLWRPEPGAWSGDNLTTVLALIGIHVALTVVWIAFQSGQPPMDVSAYPTTAFRFSVLILGALVSGVVEEAAFRGYLQSHLERIGATPAILITSAVFTLMHATHGVGFLVAAGPGFFLVSILYGYLALRSGSILPGMVLHCVGDAAHTYFVVLGGNAGLLFAH